MGCREIIVSTEESKAKINWGNSTHWNERERERERERKKKYIYI